MVNMRKPPTPIHIIKGQDTALDILKDLIPAVRSRFLA